MTRVDRIGDRVGLMAERIHNPVLVALGPADSGNEGLAAKGAASDITLDPETLRSYTKAKLSLVAQLRILREALKQRCSQGRFRACEELMGKLAEDRFTLAVLGQFKRGKSSLMNAIIGRELLPVGVLPLTSAVTVLRFGPKERLLIERKDISPLFAEEVSVARLAEFVTERGNPGNCKQLKTATLELPLPLLRRGLEFVDTPGVGSAIEANTATTYGFLPQCDAVVFLTSVETPFTRVELEFLHDIRRHVQKIFFVVNKTDLLGAGEREETLEFISRSIREQMQAAEVKVFPVSSRLGLAARLAGDEAAYTASGLKALQDALAQFLSGEKARVFLSRIVDRALRLQEQEWVEIDLRKRAAQISDQALPAKVGKLNEQLRQNAAEREKLLQRLRQHVHKETDRLTSTGLQSGGLGRINSHLDRWLNHSARLSARAASERFARFVVPLLERQTRLWLRLQAERLDFACDPTVRRELEALRNNLAAIPQAAIDVFGLRHESHELTRMADHGTSIRVNSWDSCLDVEVVIPSWQLNVGSELYPLPAQSWKPAVPLVRGSLPASLARSWLRRILLREWTVWAAPFRDRVTELLLEAVGRAFDKWADAVGKQATEAGARVLAAVTGAEPSPKTPPRDSSPLDSRWSEAALESLRANLARLRQEILTLGTPACPTEFTEPASRITHHVPTPLSVRLPDPALLERDLTTDLHTRGCAVCEHLARFAFEFFSKWQYALFTDEQAQRNFAVELGFCPLHTWQFEAVSSPVGASVGHARLIEEVSRLLARAAEAPQTTRFPFQILRTSANCRVCQMQGQAEAAYIRQLAVFVQTPAGRQAYSRSQGPCLRHLGLLIAAASREDIARFLLAEAARHFEEMAEDMQSFGMKTESLRRALRNRDEEDAYRRALIHLVGGKGNCAPWDNDVEI